MPAPSARGVSVLPPQPQSEVEGRWFCAALTLVRVLQSVNYVSHKEWKVGNVAELQF